MEREVTGDGRADVCTCRDMQSQSTSQGRMGNNVPNGRICRDVGPYAAEEHAIRGREKSTLDGVQQGATVSALLSIGQTLSSYHGRHELQPRHP